MKQPGVVVPSSVSSDPGNANISFRSFFEIVIGLAAVVAAVYYLHLEEALGLIRVLGVAAGGFLLYAFLPLYMRLPFLFALTVSAMLVLLGPLEGAILLGFSLALFGIINLPVSIRNRTLLLVLAGVVLALIRLERMSFSWGSTVTMILGGLFMFRSIMYLYEARFVKKTADIWLRLNYFFLLPNLVFTIFPVVDYKTFIRNYYSKPAYETYRKGILWMANGVLHLFIYRLIYYFLIPNPTEIASVFDWLQYVVFSYALIVRLAGIFHLSAGVICLFGFDLPPTFHHYFFASSFTDLWRRLNIYWRDFVVKVFYYPVYFKIKRIGTVKAIAISILITFAINWLLHFYQWFWLRGNFLFTVQDITFWAIFGIAVMVNSVYEARPKNKKPVQEGFLVSSALRLTLQIMGTFSFMVVIWSWWTTPSISAWWGSLQVWRMASSTDLMILLVGGVIVALIGIFFIWMIYHYDHSEGSVQWVRKVKYPLGVAFIGLLASIGTPQVSARIGAQFNIDMRPILTTQLNAADRENQFKGYYEQILSEKNLLSTPLEEVQMKRPADWRNIYTYDVLEWTGDLIEKKLKPDLGFAFKGSYFETNSLGLRDRPVNYKRDEEILRFVLLGGSIEMGSGVTTEETYENLVEDMLNEEQVYDSYKGVEIVNLSAPGLHLPQQIARVDRMVPQFNPHAVIYTCHSNEIKRYITKLHRIHTDTINVNYQYLNDLYTELDLPRDVDISIFRKEVNPVIFDAMEWGLTYMKEQISAMGALPIWMFVPALDGTYDHDENEMLFKLAEDLGFYILDLRNYGGELTEEDLALRPWDKHPNALAQKLMADKMFIEILENEVLKSAISDHQSNQIK